MYNWFSGQNRAFRMIGKSNVNGVEYGAVVAYDDTSIILVHAWNGNNDVTDKSVLAVSYR